MSKRRSGRFRPCAVVDLTDWQPGPVGVVIAGAVGDRRHRVALATHGQLANLAAPLCVADYRQRVGQPVHAHLRLDAFVRWPDLDGSDTGKYGALPARQALCGLAGSDCRHLFWASSVTADRQIVGTAVLSTPVARLRDFPSSSVLARDGVTVVGDGWPAFGLDSRTECCHAPSGLNSLTRYDLSRNAASRSGSVWVE